MLRLWNGCLKEGAAAPRPPFEKSGFLRECGGWGVQRREPKAPIMERRPSFGGNPNPRLVPVTLALWGEQVRSAATAARFPKKGAAAPVSSVHGFRQKSSEGGTSGLARLRLALWGVALLSDGIRTSVSTPWPKPFGVLAGGPIRPAERLSSPLVVPTDSESRRSIPIFVSNSPCV